MFCGNSRGTSVSPNGDCRSGGTGAGNREDVTVVRTTVVVVVVVVVVVEEDMVYMVVVVVFGLENCRKAY
jgi:hypothetical protein